ncbi:DUF1722 domain-containing protein [Macrococcoides caseolyticum]|uniref:DUF1722 domain-containing protein n=1 Tax=Macrococcoides caseolyticum TaxID=69966 RepID=UPI001F30054D|nr:DUF1722 domain-containing protein [Macrococcus caseolyticus]MCE4956569.1 YbgA family protein [Macrococcus caseolyticus]
MVNKEGKKAVESLWKKEKYKVMYYNQNQYNTIRQLMRESLDDLSILEAIINETYQMTPTKGSKINSYQHMWGYFKKIATTEEKETYQKYISTFEHHEQDLHELLKKLSLKYDITYLINSSILFT